MMAELSRCEHNAYPYNGECRVCEEEALRRALPPGWSCSECMSDEHVNCATHPNNTDEDIEWAWYEWLPASVTRRQYQAMQRAVKLARDMIEKPPGWKPEYWDLRRIVDDADGKHGR